MQHRSFPFIFIFSLEFRAIRCCHRAMPDWIWWLYHALMLLSCACCALLIGVFVGVLRRNILTSLCAGVILVTSVLILAGGGKGERHPFHLTSNPESYSHEPSIYCRIQAVALNYFLLAIHALVFCIWCERWISVTTMLRQPGTFYNTHRTNQLKAEKQANRGVAAERHSSQRSAATPSMATTVTDTLASVHTEAHRGSHLPPPPGPRRKASVMRRDSHTSMGRRSSTATTVSPSTSLLTMSTGRLTSTSVSTLSQAAAPTPSSCLAPSGHGMMGGCGGMTMRRGYSRRDSLATHQDLLLEQQRQCHGMSTDGMPVGFEARGNQRQIGLSMQTSSFHPPPPPADVLHYPSAVGFSRQTQHAMPGLPTTAAPGVADHVLLEQQTLHPTLHQRQRRFALAQPHHVTTVPTMMPIAEIGSASPPSGDDLEGEVDAGNAEERRQGMDMLHARYGLKRPSVASIHSMLSPHWTTASGPQSDTWTSTDTQNINPTSSKEAGPADDATEDPIAKATGGMICSTNRTPSLISFTSPLPHAHAKPVSYPLMSPSSSTLYTSTATSSPRRRRAVVSANAASTHFSSTTTRLPRRSLPSPHPPSPPSSSPLSPIKAAYASSYGGDHPVASPPSRSSTSMAPTPNQHVSMGYLIVAFGFPLIPTLVLVTLLVKALPSPPSNSSVAGPSHAASHLVHITFQEFYCVPVQPHWLPPILTRIWYMMFALVGIGFAASILLDVHRHRHMHIKRATLYRLVVAVLTYTVVATLSFLPDLIRTLSHGSDAPAALPVGPAGTRRVSLGMFMTCTLGMALFLMDGLQPSAVATYRRWYWLALGRWFSPSPMST